MGKVSQVVGDTDADVFTGLAVSLHLLGKARFVPSERVRGIWPDRVELDLTAEQVEELPEHEEVPVGAARAGGRFHDAPAPPVRRAGRPSRRTAEAAVRESDPSHARAGGSAEIRMDTASGCPPPLRVR